MREYIIFSQSLENFLIDLSSYFIILIILILLNYTKYINKRLLIFFSFYSSTPFFFNDVLISSESMWDQYTNVFHLTDFRAHLFSNEYFSQYMQPTYENNFYQDKKLIIGSHILGLAPIIYVNSINSIAFINKLLLMLTSIYLIKNDYIKKSNLFFILLFPSTIIYSSLSLKEVLLGIASVWAFITIEKKKYFAFLTIVLIFFFIRPQYIGFIGTFIIIYHFQKYFFNNKTFLLIIYFFIVAILYLFSEIIFEYINYKIRVYNQEDAGWGSKLDITNINFISFSFTSIVTNIKIVLNKLILNWPLPLKFKILFIFENITLFYFIFKNFKSDLQINSYKAYMSFIFLFLAIFFLYIMFPNMLPLHRYFYPYLLFYLFISKLNFKNENNSYNK